MGAKVGEIGPDNAIVHVRLTEIPGQPEPGSRVPGKEGIARIVYSLHENFKKSGRTEWLQAKEVEDYSIQFSISELDPGTRIYYRVEMKSSAQGKTFFAGPYSFKTAPLPEDDELVRFQVTTGQDLRGMDLYNHMASLNPDFLVSTGDNVYYDKIRASEDDQHLGRTVEQAYISYEKMYGCEQLVQYMSGVGNYFEKDDHDYRYNDADPYSLGKKFGKKYKEEGAKIYTTEEGVKLDTAWLSHEEGIMVFKKVFPMSDTTYRTFRWGKGVQIWLPEGRDFRSSNAMADGPDKTIWGSMQKKWLKRTILESDAHYRIIVSPTPIIGPDRSAKRDNHADKNGFWTEGQEFLDWIIENQIENLIIICGDRHWQHHSIGSHGVHEFSCGPTSDLHVQAVPESEHLDIVYSASRGGFLQVTYEQDSKLHIEFFNQDGNLNNEFSFSGKTLIRPDDK